MKGNMKWLLLLQIRRTGDDVVLTRRNRSDIERAIAVSSFRSRRASRIRQSNRRVWYHRAGGI